MSEVDTGRWDSVAWRVYAKLLALAGEFGTPIGYSSGHEWAMERAEAGFCQRMMAVVERAGRRGAAPVDRMALMIAARAVTSAGDAGVKT